MEPLAARMRPRTLDEFVGQEAILGPGRLLRRAIQADMLSSVIFYGPPGTGKTTLAQVIANTTRSSFMSINAVLAGVKDLREAIDEARQNAELYDRRTILFVDEVHRWNRAQQDALLPWVENGTVILIGATTHNPFFEVNSALVSRSRIFQLSTLTPDDLREIARRALKDPVRGYGQLDVRIDEDALEHLVAVSDGDARSLLGALQLAVETTLSEYPAPPGSLVAIDRTIAEDSIQRKAVLYDKEGDYHFDVISAFIKSIRGSDPDAALYWLARMVHGGEDPRYIFRRMLIAASEDVGLADPHALGVVESAVAAFERVGLPEGRFHLAQAALYLATCPKSNSTLGFFDALKSIEEEERREVPNHLRDASRDKEGFGHGAGYLYPHAYAEHWIAQAYLPGELQGRIFYQPSDQGYEATIGDRIERLRELQLEVGLPESPEEILSYSRTGDREFERWIARTEVGRARALADLRDLVVDRASIARHHRVLVAGRRASLYLWEAVRAAPEGRVVGLVEGEMQYESAVHHACGLGELTRPLVINSADRSIESLVAATGSAPPERPTANADQIPAGKQNGETDSVAANLAGLRFERVILGDGFDLSEDLAGLFRALAQLAADRARLVLVQRLPRFGQRLSEFGVLEETRLRSALEAAEESIFSGDATKLQWSLESARRALEESGWTVREEETRDMLEPRRLDAERIAAWLNPERAGGLGMMLAKAAGEERRAAVEAALIGRLAGQAVDWRVRYLTVVAEAAAAEP